jgi:hypothetical protein
MIDIKNIELPSVLLYANQKNKGELDIQNLDLQNKWRQHLAGAAKK